MIIISKHIICWLFILIIQYLLVFSSHVMPYGVCRRFSKKNQCANYFGYYRTQPNRMIDDFITKEVKTWLIASFFSITFQMVAMIKRKERFNCVMKTFFFRRRERTIETVIQMLLILCLWCAKSTFLRQSLGLGVKWKFVFLGRIAREWRCQYIIDECMSFENDDEWHNLQKHHRHTVNVNQFDWNMP